MLEATHLVAGGSGVPLKRTPKLLAGIGCCRFVVDIEWLYQSAKEGKILDGLEFILCDAEVCSARESLSWFKCVVRAHVRSVDGPRFVRPIIHIV